MKNKVNLLPSGIPLVDKAWGGFYRGGTYLLIGAKKSGRTLLGLQYAMECAGQNEICLYFTSMRPKDLMIHAASIDFDLQYYMNKNLIIVVRVAPPSDMYEEESSDSFLAEYLNDIVTVVDQHKPNKIVFDELTPFIGFEDINFLNEAFANSIDQIEESGITSLFIIGDPATAAAKELTEVLVSNSTGIVYLQKREGEEITSGGKIIITPNIGHTEGQFSAKYTIEPYKGIVDDYGQKEKIKKSAVSYKNSLYKPISEIETAEDLNSQIFNYYTQDDFNLILSNQIALYKSTGQSFSVISFRLAEEAEKTGLMTINQLQSTVRLASDKKDKICLAGNKILLLLNRDEQQGIASLIQKIKSNLPYSDQNKLKMLYDSISFYSMKIDDSIQSAGDLLELLGTDEVKEKKQMDLR